MSTFVVHAHGEGYGETTDEIYGTFRSSGKAQDFSDKCNAIEHTRTEEARSKDTIFFGVERVNKPKLEYMDWVVEDEDG